MSGKTGMKRMSEPLHGLDGKDFTDVTTGQLDWVKVSEALQARHSE